MLEQNVEPGKRTEFGCFGFFLHFILHIEETSSERIVVRKLGMILFDTVKGTCPGSTIFLLEVWKVSKAVYVWSGETFDQNG